MEITQEVQGQVLIITLLGENLDAKESPEFKEKILNSVEEAGVKHVVFNLQQLNFIDSSGLGCFLSILRRLNADGGDLKLVHMSKSVKSMFELVSMHKIFDIFNTLSEAQAAINKEKV